MNKKRAWAIIDVDNPQSSSGRQGCKLSYNDKNADEIKTCFIKNYVVFKTVQAVVWLKYKYSEVVGVTNSPSEKYIKTKFSALKQSFKEDSEDI